MKKRALSLFMALALCLSMAPEVSFAEEAGAVTEQEAQSSESADDGYTTGNETPGNDIIGNDVSGGDVSDGDTNAEVQDAEKDAAVLSVQEQINALPDVDALPAMEEDEILAAYMAVQEAYAAYDALTAEQQAQITGADCFEDLFGWFNGQIAPLEVYTNIESGVVGVVNEETGERKSWSGSRTGCHIVDADVTTAWGTSYDSYYVLKDKEDVTLSSLTVQGSSPAYLYLGKDTTLTISGPITFRNGGCLFVYGASDGSGKVIINNTSDSAAIQAEGESNGSYLAVCGGTLEITSTSGRITDGVYLVNGNDSYHYMEYTIDDKAVAYDENKEMLEGKTIAGTKLTLTWCEHKSEYVTYVPSSETQHIMNCAQCGFVGTAVACEFDNPDSYDPGDANGHYAKCFCGNVDTTNQLEHQFVTMPTDNGQYHTSRCGYCNYIEGGAEQEAHIWDTAEGDCEVCDFMPVAKDSLDNLYDGGTQTGVKTALDAVADGNGAEYVELYSKKADDKGITENVEFEHPGKTVELRMNGYTLQANGNPTLRVTDGTLNITGDATIKSIGQSQETVGYGISVSGGKLIFEGNLNAEGGLHDKTRRSAVTANGGELEFKGGLDLNGGLTLTGDAKLTDGLTQGTFRAEGDTNGSARVSVEGSNVYSNVQGLLAEGYAFVDQDDENVFVDASAKALTKDVTIVKHTHDYQPVDGSGDYQCVTCGLTCSHDGGFSGGACAVCHKPCPHTNATKSKEDNQYYCNACETAMLVQIEKDGKTWFGADFRAAMCEAEDGTKITLLADVVMSGWSKAKISGDNKVVTLDLNGHNITGRGGIYVGKNDNSATCRLNIMGAGSIETVTIDLKGTLDLSGWTGSTIRDLNISDNSTYPENEREAGLIVGSKAGTIQTLSFGNNQLSKREKIKLSGGSYGEISELGFTAVKLGDLLEVGYAFQNANGTYVNYEQTINRAAIYNVKVVKCPHEKVGEDGTCVYCNKTGIAATLDGEAYSDVNTAVTDWLSKGGVLKLCTDYSGSIDFSSATNPLTIDLNGHSFNQGKEMSLNGASLTITDTSTTASGNFGQLAADNGTLILEGGKLEELNVPENSPAAISLRGGGFTAGTISCDAYKMLEDGYYLLHDGAPVNPANATDGPSTGDSYQIKKADITAGGEKNGTVTFGENRVPIGANVSVGEDGITHVQFGWYAVTDNGAVVQLAESDEVALSDEAASYEPNAADCEAYAARWNGLYGGKTYELLCVVTGKDSNNSTQWQTVLKGYQLGVEQASLDSEKTVITQQANSGNTGNKADNRLVVTPNADGGLDDVTYKFNVYYDGKMLARDTDYTIKDGNTAKNAGEHTLIIEGTGNYTGEKTVTWTIEPYELSAELAFNTQVTKSYDGTVAADESTQGVADLGVFKIDSGNLRNPVVSLNGSEIDLTDSVIRTDLRFDSEKAGSRTFSFTLTLKGDNFVFADGEKAAEFELSGAKAAISKKTIDAPAAKDLSVVNGHEATYTVDLTEMLPELASPMKYGDVQYSIDGYSLDPDYYTSSNQASIEDGQLKLPILESQQTGDVNVGTVTVKVTSDNVEDFILTIKVTARDKIVPQLDGTLTLDPAEITYGDKLSKIATISGTMKDGNEEVPGTFVWQNPDAVLNAGTHDVTWVFTPTDNMNYAVATGTVTVKVNKAEQGGTVSMISYTYNAAPNTPTLTGRTGDSSATVTYYYSTTDTNEGGTEWKNIDSTTLDAETYYMYAVIGATENYKEFTTPAVRFVVWKAAPEYTEPTGVTAKYGQMLGEITLTNPEGNMDGKWSWEAPATIPNKTGEAVYNVRFKPTSENYKEVTEIAINVTVVKGDGKNLATDELTQKFTDSSEHTYTPDWSGLPAGQTWSYSCASSVSNGSAAKLTTKVSAENGELTYAVSGGEVGDTITVTLKASCENYKDFTVTLNITLTEKDNQKPLTITGSNIGVYGQTMKLGTTGGSGTGKVTYSIEAGSEGEATIDADGVLTPVKAGYIVVRATKAADAEYNEITSDRFEILITQAPTTGEPRYTKITTGGKTLADAGLTLEGGTLNPAEGKLEWIDFEGDTLPNDTEVEVNAIYTWCFTPKDTNYAHLTGDVVLYYVEAPAISAQPKDASVKAGEKAVFEVTATGTDLTYQWQIDRNDGKGFVNLNGATGASYTSGVTDMDCNGFKYQCIISNVAGSVTTETVTLTVTVYYTITATAGEHGSISPSGAVEVAEGSNQTFTITADAGYEIESLKVDGTEVSVAASYTFETVKAAHTIEVTFKVVVYEIIGGADSSWTQNVDGSLAIRGNGEIADFQKVLVDGNVVDPENYIVTEGSTIITLKPEFLSTLSEGSHTFEIVWTNGSAGTSFTVAKNTSGNNGGNNNGNNNSNNSSNNNSSDNAGSSDGTADKTVIAPKTGDDSLDALLVVFVVVAFVGLAGVLVLKKKNTYK